MSDDNDLSYVRRFPNTCDEEISRNGEAQPCEKPAVAVRVYANSPYPVCKHHARGDMVPLAVLLRSES